MSRAIYLDSRIWCLGIAETLVWAGMYYLFPALLVHWESDLGWSKTELTLAATCALLVSAVVAPKIGGLIDQDAGRWILTGCAALGGVLLLLLTQVESYPVFFVIWIGIGIAMGGCLYEPCFAFLTHRRGAEARGAITMITLMAGFAGTVSFPLCNWIAVSVSWQAASGTMAVLILGIAVPLFWYGTQLRTGDTALDHLVNGPGQNWEALRKSALRQTLSRPVYWLLAGSFALLGLNHAIVVTHLLPLLDERGISLASAVFAISLLGPMQVAGRIVMLLTERWVGVIALCGCIFVSIAVGGTFLGLAAAIPILIYLFVLLQGASHGVVSILRPLVTAQLLGRTGFGAISGAVAVPFVAATALGPSAGSLIWSWGGYDLVVWALIALALIGLCCFGLAVRISARHPV
ncbi:MFS transporter [Hwanghaeella sp. LZ110]|uniref:MFS transporter n=1 Tax=Hwanghaeella sp. LZ110 TaxID=3402810 RepID=UPI003B66E12B